LAGGTPYIAMEYVAGPTLRKLLSQGRLPLERYFEDILPLFHFRFGFQQLAIGNLRLGSLNRFLKVDFRDGQHLAGGGMLFLFVLLLFVVGPNGQHE
jgi:hypothetical protein